MSRIWCWLGVHQWGQWVGAGRFALTKVALDGRKFERGEIQWRTSAGARCGQLGVKKLDMTR